MTDSGLGCLLLLASYHQLPADAGQLRHRFGGRLESVEIVRAARHLGLRARLGKVNWKRLDRMALPAICRTRAGEYVILARYGRLASGEGERGLVHEPGSRAPRMLGLAELRELLSGEAILAASRASLTGDLARFDFSWFIPALVKYRRLLGEVLLASFFLQLLALLTPIFFQVVMDKVLVHRGFSTLNVIAAGMAAVFVFEVALGGIRGYVFSHTTSRIDVELGAKLFRHLLALPQSYFAARRVGDSVARVRELDSIRNFLTGSALTVLLDFFFVFVFLIAMWYYSSDLTIIVLVSLPCYALVSLLLTPSLRRRLQEKFNRGAENQAFLVETVGGVETVKAMAVEPQLARRWDNQLASFVGASFRASHLGNVGAQLVQLISKLTTVAILWFGARAVIAGELTIGGLIAFNMLSGRVSQPVLRLAQLWMDFQQAGVSVKRLGDILNAPTERVGAARATPPPLAGAITFERVGFSYNPGDKPALSDVSLAVKPGEVIGVVGRSGSGKSTLAKLMQRAYIPQRGRVLIDGTDLALIDPAWLRRQIGVVLQDNLMFNRTIRENIAIADPTMAMEDIRRAAQLAGAEEFILELREGYETMVGEHGASLSGGQRQRLAIARALAIKPRILIFDEATSALDYESEQAIRGNMAAICAGRTVIIIAHRLSAVRRCDRIIVLERGEIVEQGGHEELLKIPNGRYARLYALQSGD